MAIKEELQLVDKVSAPARAGASAVAALDKMTMKARSSLAKLSAPASKTDANIVKMKKGMDPFVQSLKKAKDEMARDHRAAAKIPVQLNKIPKPIKEATKQAKKLDAKDALGAFGLGGAIGSGIVTGAALLMGVVNILKSAVSGAFDLARGFTEAFVGAVKLRGESKAMMDSLTGGRGGEALALLKSQAIATGQSFEEMQENFKAARDAGASNKQAFALGNLRADIIASGRSAQEADSAINGMLSKVKSGATDASKGAAELALKFGVAGDGVAAVNKQATTFAGLITRLKAAPGNILDALASSSAGKKLDEMGAKATAFINAWIQGGGAGRLINQITAGINMVISAVQKAAPIVMAFWNGFKAGFGPVLGELSKIGAMLGRTFGGDKSTAMQSIISAANGLGKALGFVAAIAVRIASGFAIMIAAGAAVTGWFANLSSSARITGNAVIDGLVGGIKAGIGRAIQAAKDVANAIKGALASVIQPGSPSRMATKMARTIPQGLAKGEAQGMREVESASRAMAVAAMPSNDNSSSTPAARNTISVGGVTIQYNAGTGGTQQDARNLAEQFASFIEGQLLEAAV